MCPPLGINIHNKIIVVDEQTFLLLLYLIDILYPRETPIIEQGLDVWLNNHVVQLRCFVYEDGSEVGHCAGYLLCTGWSDELHVECTIVRYCRVDDGR